MKCSECWYEEDIEEFGVVAVIDIGSGRLTVNGFNCPSCGANIHDDNYEASIFIETARLNCKVQVVNAESGEVAESIVEIPQKHHCGKCVWVWG